LWTVIKTQVIENQSAEIFQARNPCAIFALSCAKIAQTVLFLFRDFGDKEVSDLCFFGYSFDRFIDSDDDKSVFSVFRGIKLGQINDFDKKTIYDTTKSVV
jgi:hypothetical protein